MTLRGHTVVDLHCDVFEFSRRYRRDPRKLHRKPPWFFTEGHTDLPRLEAAGFDLVLFGVYGPFVRGDRAWSVTRRTLAFLAASGPPLVAGAGDVRPGRLQGAASLEGGHLLGGRPERVAEVAAAGVVSMGLAHLGPNDCATRRGLTSLGREVLAACREAHVLVDLAHAPDAAVDDVLAADDGPVLVSHGGSRRVHRHKRMLGDDHVREVARRGGVVGVMYFPWYLKGRLWGSVDDVVDHLEAVLEVGGPGAAALGSDWDGAVTMPRGLEDPSGLASLVEAMERRGMGEAVPGVLGANFLRSWAEVDRPVRPV